MSSLEPVRLRVEETPSAGQGTRRAWLDSQTRLELDAPPGTVLRLEGASVTGAIAWKATEEEEGVGLHAQERENAGVELGEEVSVSLAAAYPCPRLIVEVLPVDGEASAVGQGVAPVLARRLSSKPVAQGDVLRFEAGPLLDDPLTVRVVEAPAEVTVVRDSTRIKVVGKQEGA